MLRPIPGVGAHGLSKPWIQWRGQAMEVEPAEHKAAGYRPQLWVCARSSQISAGREAAAWPGLGLRGCRRS